MTKQVRRRALLREAALKADIVELQAALEPFAEIARRLGWNKYAANDMELGEHVVEAPAPDIGPGASYCLMVGAFWRAAQMLDEYGER